MSDIRTGYVPQEQLAHMRDRRTGDETEAQEHDVESLTATQAVQELQALVPVDNLALQDQVTRMKAFMDARVLSMKISHDFVSRTEALRRAWEAGETSAFYRPPSHWEENEETGEITRIHALGGIIYENEGREVGWAIPTGELERIGRRVEHGIQAAHTLFDYNLLRLHGALSMRDIRQYVTDVVLAGQDIPAGQKESVIAAEVNRLFVVGDEQRVDAVLADEMGEDFQGLDPNDYPFTLRVRALTDPVALERLRGTCEMAHLRGLQEEQQRLLEQYGEESPLYQAYAVASGLAGMDVF